jgi:hypothetical protein
MILATVMVKPEFAARRHLCGSLRRRRAAASLSRSLRRHERVDEGVADDRHRDENVDAQRDQEDHRVRPRSRRGSGTSVAAVSWLGSRASIRFGSSVIGVFLLAEAGEHGDDGVERADEHDPDDDGAADEIAR